MGNVAGEYGRDSYCGIYCGACDLLVACRRGEPGSFSPGFKAAIPARDDYRCRGCKSELVFGNCASCPIRACARARGIEHCSDCGEYPCEPLRRIRYESPHPGLPHLSLCHENLEAIKARGTEAWLEEQVALWRCPSCSAPDSWYSAACPRCGEPLAGRKPFDASCGKGEPRTGA